MTIDIDDLLTRARAVKNGRLAESVVHDGAAALDSGRAGGRNPAGSQ